MCSAQLTWRTACPDWNSTLKIPWCLPHSQNIILTISSTSNEIKRRTTDLQSSWNQKLAHMEVVKKNAIDFGNVTCIALQIYGTILRAFMKHQQYCLCQQDPARTCLQWRLASPWELNWSLHHKMFKDERPCESSSPACHKLQCQP